MEFTKGEENNFGNIDLLKDRDTAKLREKRRGLYVRRK